jgi:hypothetical protein
MKLQKLIDNLKKREDELQKLYDREPNWIHPEVAQRIGALQGRLAEVQRILDSLELARDMGAEA